MFIVAFVIRVGTRKKAETYFSFLSDFSLYIRILSFALFSLLLLLLLFHSALLLTRRLYAMAIVYTIILPVASEIMKEWRTQQQQQQMKKTLVHSHIHRQRHGRKQEKKDVFESTTRERWKERKQIIMYSRGWRNGWMDGWRMMSRPCTTYGSHICNYCIITLWFIPFICDSCAQCQNGYSYGWFMHFLLVFFSLVFVSLICRSDKWSHARTSCNHN